ncbi:hypothetical protein Agub_g10499, partial [Astrephomene gubernaculifera]
MGLDGGTVVTRSDVLRGQSWRVAQNDTSRSTRGGNVTRVPTEAVDKNIERATAWSTCSLTSQPLQPPIVACGLGRLYNKDAVLQFLLCKKDKISDPEALLQYANQLRVAAGSLDHITCLKDVLEVQLQDSAASAAADLQINSTTTGTTTTAAAAFTLGASTSAAAAVAASGTTTADDFLAAAASRFVCPVTLLPCHRHPCSALRPCGHVISDRALRNLRGSGDPCCPVCSRPYTSELPINGTPEQVQQLREGLRAAAAAAKAAKEAKKQQQQAEGG